MLANAKGPRYSRAAEPEVVIPDILAADRLLTLICDVYAPGRLASAQRRRARGLGNDMLAVPVK